MLTQAVPLNDPVCKSQAHIRVSIQTHVHHLIKC